MGYYINVLQKGATYELDGEYIEFIKKDGNLFYFYSCKFDEWSFKYKRVNEICIYGKEQITYIKKVQDGTKKSGLKKIGKDKVFPRY